MVALNFENDSLFERLARSLMLLRREWPVFFVALDEGVCHVSERNVVACPIRRAQLVDERQFDHGPPPFRPFHWLERGRAPLLPDLHQ